MDDIKAQLTLRFHALLKEYNVTEQVLLEFVDEYDALGCFIFEKDFNSEILLIQILSDGIETEVSMLDTLYHEFAHLLDHLHYKQIFLEINNCYPKRNIKEVNDLIDALKTTKFDVHGRLFKKHLKKFTKDVGQYEGEEYDVEFEYLEKK